MNLNLQGKTAIVTGAARGIGKAVALTFAREGANVVVDDLDGEAAAAVVKEASASGIKAVAEAVDVTKFEDVKKMVARTLDKFGRLDILVNNTGILYIGGKWVMHKLFAESGPEDWRKEVDLVFYGVLNCTGASVPAMLKQKSGAIVNVVSDGGRGGMAPGLTIYGGGKGGVIAFSRNLAYELGPQGIRVNCVSPGTIKTSRLEALDFKKEKTADELNYIAMIDGLAKQKPLGRIGLPQEVANAVVFLSSDVSSFTTGQTLSVNGGWIMP